VSRFCRCWEVRSALKRALDWPKSDIRRWAQEWAAPIRSPSTSERLISQLWYWSPGRSLFAADWWLAQRLCGPSPHAAVPPITIKSPRQILENSFAPSIARMSRPTNPTPQLGVRNRSAAFSILLGCQRSHGPRSGLLGLSSHSDLFHAPSVRGPACGEPPPNPK